MLVNRKFCAIQVLRLLMMNFNSKYIKTYL